MMIKLPPLRSAILRSFFALCAAVSLFGEATNPPPALIQQGPLSRLSPFEAIVLGVVEGVTEFLPISSTGHLIIATDHLGLNSEQPLFGPGEEVLWYRKPEEGGSGELLTVNLATQAYIVIIQFGAIAAIIPICWSQFVSMFNGLRGRDPKGLRLLKNLVIAFVPSAVLGLLIHDWIDAHLHSVGAVVFGLAAGSLLMFLAQRWGESNARDEGYRTEISSAGAVGIGLAQCLAMWPGTSRPMITIVGAYFAGLPPGPAAAFSFLLGFVTLTAATLYKCLKSGDLVIQVFGWQNVLLGIVIAAITASISVRFFVKLLLREGLAPFAWYRLAVALFLLISA